MSASQPSRFAPSPSQSRPRHEFVFEPLLDSDEAAAVAPHSPKNAAANGSQSPDSRNPGWQTMAVPCLRSGDLAENEEGRLSRRLPKIFTIDPPLHLR